jgi:hypothetical protein
MDIAVKLLKWLSQILILVGGVWALFSDTHERDPTTGRRNLTRSGWLKLSIFGIGFALFALTERQSEMQHHEASRIQEEQIKQQKHQLDILQELFLLQREVSAVDVSWPLSAKDQTVFSESLLGYRDQSSSVSPELKTNLQYIDAAFRNSMRPHNNWLNVREIARGRFGLQVLVSRHAPPKLVQFSEDQPDWKVFASAIGRLLGDRFEIDLAPGVVIADLAKKHWPCALSIGDCTIHFTVEKPGVRLGQLEGASVTLWAAVNRTAQLLKRLHLLLKDPRVEGDQQFELDWTEVVLFSAKDEEEGYEVKYSNLKAGPFPLSTRIKYDIVLPADKTP